MTPKEKARELVGNMQVEHDIEKRCYYFHMSLASAKRSALIAVGEKLETLNKIKFVIDCIDLRQYYLDVKQEIEKL